MTKAELINALEPYDEETPLLIVTPAMESGVSHVERWILESGEACIALLSDEEWDI